VRVYLHGYWADVAIAGRGFKRGTSYDGEYIECPWWKVPVVLVRALANNCGIRGVRRG
jgi:hypothetical protein